MYDDRSILDTFAMLD